MIKVRKSCVRQAFSRSAGRYDAMADLQRDIGQTLLEKYRFGRPTRDILDIGTGTGWAARRLSQAAPGARVVGVDFAEEMLRKAKSNFPGIQFVLADARNLPFRSEAFDLIVSNLAYQWVDHLPSAFKMVYSSLRPGGSFCASVFGSETMKELFDSFAACEDVRLRDRLRSVRRLPQYKEIMQATELAGFEEINIEHEVRKIYFSDLLSIMRWLKAIGANGMGRGVFIGKKAMREASGYYQKHYADGKGSFASFEILYLHAMRKSG